MGVGFWGRIGKQEKEELWENEKRRIVPEKNRHGVPRCKPKGGNMDGGKKVPLYVELWKFENQVKTQKLMAYLVAQPLLVLGLASGAKYGEVCYFFFSVLGILFSIWWFFCIGRTVGYQTLWKYKIETIGSSDFFPSKEEKRNQLPWYGKVNAKMIVFSPPVLGAIIWLIILVYLVAKVTK